MPICEFACYIYISLLTRAPLFRGKRFFLAHKDVWKKISITMLSLSPQINLDSTNPKKKKNAHKAK